MLTPPFVVARPGGRRGRCAPGSAPAAGRRPRTAAARDPAAAPRQACASYSRRGCARAAGRSRGCAPSPRSRVSGTVALMLASRLFKHMPESHSTVSFYREAKGLVGYAAPISACQLLNTFILRLDVFMLGWFIGRAPGVTFATVAVYSVVVDIAS